MKHLLFGISLLFTTSLIAQTEWVRTMDFVGSARNHPVTFSIGNYGYIVTGYGDNGFLKDMYRFDFALDTMGKMPDFPGAARGLAYGVSHGDKAYVGFGTNGSTYLNDFWEFDATTEAWTSLASCPCVGRTHPALVATDNGKIFVGAGSNGSNLRDWWEYDIATNVWTQKTSVPGGERHHPFYFGIGDSAYVGLGHGNGPGTNIYNDFYKWDATTDTWTTLGAFPAEGRVAGEQFSFDGKGYIVSGQGADHLDLDTGEMHVYHPDLDMWFAETPHPGTARWAPGTLVSENGVYLLGGQVDNAQGQRENLTSMYFYELKPLTSVQQEEMNTREVSVYPNPVRSKMTVTADRDIASLKLYSIEGKEFMLEANNGSYQLSDDVTAGNYILHFLFEDGSSHTEKVVIEPAID